LRDFDLRRKCRHLGEEEPLVSVLGRLSRFF
jgi:hypothetical protein